MTTLASVSERSPHTRKAVGLSTSALFAGIGGIEKGLSKANHHTELLCEIDPGAQAVLRGHFPGVEMLPDIAALPTILDWAEVVTAGFPCQDLSQAGRTQGITGTRSGLIAETFKRIDRKARNPRWLVLENVSFMLHLNRGAAMSYLVQQLEALDFTWAYRVVDTRAFGLPQRRLRVVLVASRTEDPRAVLFADEAGENKSEYQPGLACGFYWTEGNTGLGWAVDAIPTLKGGSALGIPSPPAIWLPDGSIVVPDIRDAERFQGFAPDWTLPAIDGGAVRQSWRWKLVGNAVSVPVFAWIGKRLANPGKYQDLVDEPLAPDAPWPKAGWGRKGKAYSVQVSTFPLRAPYHHLDEFLQYRPKRLSLKAADGFLQRALASRLRFVEGFLDAVRAHVSKMRDMELSRSSG